MANYKVTFKPADITVEVDPSDYPFGKHGQPGSILDIALAKGIEIPNSCGGVGICTTCHVIVEEGQKNLSEPDDDELDSLDAVTGSTLQSRLACQAVVKGDVTVIIPQK